ncbi:hypothetical protein [Metabacillus indicus]|uniref:hypothetical protein n=1 Tax=Metabacillus indicus TaxID=246786 RepID=UPI0024909AF5|nr:hypothetical protein [Metabacillus indicus]
MSKKNTKDKKVKVKVIFLDESETDSLSGELEQGDFSDSLAGESAVTDFSDSLAGESAITDFTESLAGVIGEVVEESLEAATKHVSCEKNYKKYFKEKYKHKYKRKYKKCCKKQKISIAYGSLYTFGLGSFALPGEPVNFTVAGPLRHVDANLSDNYLEIKKAGVYEVIFLADIMTTAAIANFAFFRNNTLIDISRFTLMTSDVMQTTVGKTVQIELDEEDEITVRTLNVSSPNVEYAIPAVQLLNAALTVKLLDQS